MIGTASPRQKATKQRATLMGVARRAGVALDTARRAIQGAPSVRSYLRERVLHAARELDYRPNLVARALKSQSLRMVTIAAQEFGQLYFARLVHYLSEKLIAIGMEPTLCFDNEHTDAVASEFTTCASILVTGATDEILGRLCARQKVVTVNANVKTLPPNAANVAIDIAGAYRRLTEAMIAHGRRHVAICSSHYLRCLEMGWPREKMPCVIETLARHGLRPVAPDGAASPDKAVFATPVDVVAHLERHPGSIDAVVCENDLGAAMLVAELAALGLRTPDDVLVAGCDANFPVRGIWTLRIDESEIADRVVRLLQGLLANDVPAIAPYRLALLDENQKEID